MADLDRRYYVAALAGLIMHEKWALVDTFMDGKKFTMPECSNAAALAVQELMKGELPDTDCEVLVRRIFENVKAREWLGETDMPMLAMEVIFGMLNEGVDYAGDIVGYVAVTYLDEVSILESAERLKERRFEFPAFIAHALQKPRRERVDEIDNDVISALAKHEPMIGTMTGEDPRTALLKELDLLTEAALM